MAQRKVTVAYDTERARWEAVLKRDRLAGNAFVYTVSSTGIYCRPTCPARVARRANVGFHDHASEAAALGYRPCKRCKPEVSEGQPEDAAVTAIRGFVEKENFGNGEYLTLRQMADAAGLSKWHFHRTFVKVVGITPGEWVKTRRANQIPSVVPTIPTLATNYYTLESEATSPRDSTLTASTPTSSEGIIEDFEQLFKVDIPEDEWMKMIDFEALGESVEWNSFDT